jgi:hypothetical protein
MQRQLALLIALAALCTRTSDAALPSIASAAAMPVVAAAHLGGGNVGTNGDATADDEAMLAALSLIGAGGTRSNLYPGAYIKDGRDWDAPTPESVDAFMALALAHNVTPVLLFEHYAPDFVNASGFGSYTQWFNVGAAFAAHLGPGGTWAKAHGAPASFGVTDFTAINEPDGGAGFVKGGVLGPERYAEALSGLSAGVKSVLPNAKVFPGGFMSVNAFSDCTLRGLAAALGPLWANGTLDGVDLHTYFDVQFAPMEGTHAHSAQANYDCVMSAAGLAPEQAARVLFTTTEFNYKKRLVDEAYAARGLFTAIFDQVGVVDHANQPLARRVFPWNIFNLNNTDADYGMAASLSPYVPTPRGCTWARAVALLTQPPAGGEWRWVSADPRGTGVLVMASPDGAAQLTVRQNRAGWSSLAGATEFVVRALPAQAASLLVVGFDGVRRAVPLAPGQGSATVAGLGANETFAFLALPAGAPPLRLPPGCA